MPGSFAGDSIQLWVANPSAPAVFSPIPGELRCKVDIERSTQTNPAIRSQPFASMLSHTGQATISLEVEGHASHAPAEQWLHAASISGEPCLLRLKIADQHWLEGQFAILRHTLDAPQGDVASFRFGAINQGFVTLTPLS